MPVKKIETIIFNWDKSAKTGSSTLLLNMSVLRKYALPHLIHDYDGEVGKFIVPIQKLDDYNEAKDEIEKYKSIFEETDLSKESPFHVSHILYLLINFMENRNSKIIEQQFIVKLNNMAYLLRNLMSLDNFNSYNVTITGKLDEFKYSFLSENWLKEDVLKFLVEKVKSRVKKFDRKIFDMLLSGATEKQLEEAIRKQTFHKVEKSLISDLVKNLIKYFNSETQSFRNPNRDESLSITNKQGDFIYELLAHFRIYKPKKTVNNSVVKHHDAIRKLIKRSSILSEDKKK